MATLEQLALVFTPGIGPTLCRRLADYCSPDELFRLSRHSLTDIFGDRPSLVAAIASRTGFERAERELQYTEKHHIRPLFFTEPDFPSRLNRPETIDCPALLYVLGNADLNASRAIAMVGTRKSTLAGNAATAQLVQELQPLGTTIISGLAYGIDTASHHAALDVGLPTVAVLGHGLDRIYPPANRNLATSILEHGGALVTEYPSYTDINPRYFPARNRIIAALTDATVVVEAKEKGGALITATIAGGYQREVFAVPGRLSDPTSVGTNSLIATNKAHLLRSADDIAYHMGWPMPGDKGLQTSLFPTLTAEQEHFRKLVEENAPVHIEELTHLSGAPLPKVAALLFDLELLKVIRALPGRRYEIA